MDKNKAKKIFDLLAEEYPEATTALSHADPLQLLVATILSAQCTDARVNMLTGQLFKKYRKVSDYALADRTKLEKEIRSTGFYRNKAKNIIAAARMIQEDFGGKVPDEMEDLTSLPGVARKTANIVLFHGYGKNSGIAVDTHVKRLSGRIGLSDNTDPEKIEQDLMGLFSKRRWGSLSDLLILHGRKICGARKPLCGECSLKRLCRSCGKI